MAPSDELAAGGKLEDAVDIAEWLRGLGLEKYAPAFDENAINWDVLSELTTDDLKEIGVAAVGDRRRLLTAIGALDALRSRGPARDRRRLSSLRHRHRRPLWRVCCQVYGRRRADLFRLPRGA